MKTDFILPDIGEGIVECELVEWRIAEGDPIEEDQPVADVLTDKALVEITAMHTGTVTRLYCQQGDLARVHEPLFEVEVSANSDVQAAPAAQATTAATEGATASGSASRSTTAEEASSAQDRTDASRRQEGKVLTTPAVRRMARELDLDLSRIPGSGKKGRVLKEDLLPYQRGEMDQRAEPAATHAPGPTGRAPGEDRTEPIRGIRAAMARQVSEAASTIPHFTYADEVDVTALEALRQELKPRFAEQDIRLSLMPLIIKSLELAIRQHPVLNSRVNADCSELTYLADVNIGMATDTPSGLLVPNVKQVQIRSLMEVAQEVNRLTELARVGRLNQEDMRGGTISVSNIGALGGTFATPIINKPEVAIVALGRIQSLPRFAADGSVTARQIMPVSWSGDHRIIDGATMARFCNLWKQYLGQPAAMLSDLR